MNKIKKFITIIMELVFQLAAFCITRFDNLSTSLLSLVDKNVSKKEKENTLLSAFENIVVFVPASMIIDELLEFSKLQKYFLTAFVLTIGLLCYIIVLIVSKGECWKEFPKMMTITLRLGFLMRLMMWVILMISKIPIIGPISLFLFVVVNLPKCFKRQKV